MSGVFAFDAPQPCQILYQDAATRMMDNITDLHHDIMFFLVMISTFVFYLMARIVLACKITDTAALKQSMLFDIIFTIVFFIVFVFMALALIQEITFYHESNVESSKDTLIEPKVTMKDVGHQWE